MKKTKFKLILNSNSYRIYTDNGIEYCRFKKKYYPLNEIENVINSYKIGGVLRPLQITDDIFSILCIAILKTNLTYEDLSNEKNSNEKNTYTLL